MTKTLSTANDVIRMLPPPRQDDIDQFPIGYFGRLAKLRAAIAFGEIQLADGKGVELNEDVWASMRNAGKYDMGLRLRSSKFAHE